MRCLSTYTLKIRSDMFFNIQWLDLNREYWHFRYYVHFLGNIYNQRVVSDLMKNRHYEQAVLEVLTPGRGIHVVRTLRLAIRRVGLARQRCVVFAEESATHVLENRARTEGLGTGLPHHLSRLPESDQSRCVKYGGGGERERGGSQEEATGSKLRSDDTQ